MKIELLALLEANRAALLSSPELMEAMTAVADEHSVSPAFVAELVALSLTADQLDEIADRMDEPQ